MHASSLTIGLCFAALFINRHCEVKLVFSAHNNLFDTVIFTLRCLQRSSLKQHQCRHFVENVGYGYEDFPLLDSEMDKKKCSVK